jgi:NAD(P)H-dependent flavin oxidoreductase YrpB (nitropropane dioxygenase family)
MMMRMSQMLKMHTITLTTGNLETGMTASGMSVGLIHDIPTVADLIARIMAEAEAAYAGLTTRMTS